MTATPGDRALTVVGVRWLLAVTLAACGDARPPTAAPANHAATAPTASALAGAPSVDRRCLPLVSDDCGCVYSCGVGVRAGDGWRVTHPTWGDAPLTARLAPFCVGDACTDAFHVELVCDGICAPRAADATCRFDDRGACVGAAS